MWIRDNFHILWPAAKSAFQDFGRGAIVVDTTSQPISGAGHPFGYFSHEQLQEHDDEDTKRLVREYNPRKEFVVMLIKENDQTSTYRLLRPQSRKRG